MGRPVAAVTLLVVALALAVNALPSSPDASPRLSPYLIAELARRHDQRLAKSVIAEDQRPKRSPLESDYDSDLKKLDLASESQFKPQSVVWEVDSLGLDSCQQTQPDPIYILPKLEAYGLDSCQQTQPDPIYTLPKLETSGLDSCQQTQPDPIYILPKLEASGLDSCQQTQPDARYLVPKLESSGYDIKELPTIELEAIMELLKALQSERRQRKSRFAMFSDRASSGGSSTSSGSTASSGASSDSGVSTRSDSVCGTPRNAAISSEELPDTPSVHSAAGNDSALSPHPSHGQGDDLECPLGTKACSGQSCFYATQHDTILEEVSAPDQSIDDQTSLSSDRQQIAVSAGDSAEGYFRVKPSVQQDFPKIDHDNTDWNAPSNPIFKGKQQLSQESGSSVEGNISIDSFDEENLSDVVLDTHTSGNLVALMKSLQMNEATGPVAGLQISLLSSSLSPSTSASSSGSEDSVSDPLQSVTSASAALPGLPQLKNVSPHARNPATSALVAPPGLPQLKIISRRARNAASAEKDLHPDVFEIPTTAVNAGKDFERVIESQQSLSPSASLMASSCGSCESSFLADQLQSLDQIQLFPSRLARPHVIESLSGSSPSASTQWSEAMPTSPRRRSCEQELDSSEASSVQLQFIGRTMPVASLDLPTVKRSDTLSLRKFEEGLMKMTVTNEFAALCALLTSSVLAEFSQWDGSTRLNDFLENQILRFLKDRILDSDSPDQATANRFPYLTNEVANFQAIVEAVLELSAKLGCVSSSVSINMHCIELQKTARIFLESRRGQFEVTIRGGYLDCIKHFALQIRHLTNHNMIDMERLSGSDSKALKLISDTLAAKQRSLESRIDRILKSARTRIGVQYQGSFAPRPHNKASHSNKLCEKLLLPYDDVFQFSGPMLNMLNHCVSAASDMSRFVLEGSGGTPFDISSILRSTLSIVEPPSCNALHASITTVLAEMPGLVFRFVDLLAAKVTRTLKGHSQHQGPGIPPLCKRHMTFVAQTLKVLLRNHVSLVSGSWRFSIERALDQELSKLEDSSLSDSYSVISLPLVWWVRDRDVSIDRAFSAVAYD